MANGNDEESISTQEAKRYWDAFMAAVRTIVTAQSKLEELEDSTDDIAERSGFRADRLRLGDKLAALEQGHIAFIAGKNAIKPPTKATVDGVRDLVTQVTELEAERNTAAAIVAIANKAIAEVEQIQGA